MTRFSLLHNLNFSSSILHPEQDLATKAPVPHQFPAHSSHRSCPWMMVAVKETPQAELKPSSTTGSPSSAAMQMLKKASRAQRWRKPNTEDQSEWATIIGDMKELGSPVPVLRSYRKAGKLSKETVVGTLMELKKLKEWQFVAETIVWLRKQHWWAFSGMDFNLLIAAYGKLGEPEKAERAIGHLKKAGFSPNVASFTSLIEAYGKKGMFSNAEAILTKMLEEGPMPTVLTYQTLITAFVKGGKYEDAERLFNSLEASSTIKPDQKLYNLMIHSYGKSGKLEEASRLSRKMKALEVPLSVVTYNSLLANQPGVKDAENVFSQMQRANIDPDVFTYASRLNAFAKAGRGEEACYFFKTMIASGIRPNGTVYNVLLDALANSKMVEEAESTLKQMRRDGCTPDVRSFTTLMNAYVNVADMEKAQKVFERMKIAGVEPNVVTYGTLIKGYAEVGDLDGMLKSYNKLIAQGLKANQTVFTIMIQAFGRHDSLGRAKSWFKKMVEEGHLPDERARRSLLGLPAAVERQQEVQEFLESLLK